MNIFSLMATKLIQREFMNVVWVSSHVCKIESSWLCPRICFTFAIVMKNSRANVLQKPEENKYENEMKKNL